jgi:cell filamentation protein
VWGRLFLNSKDCIKSQLIRAVNPRKYAKSNTFVNLLGIHDQKGFSVAETDCFTIRVDKYRLTPIQGNFSLIHLQIIHCHLFQDVYRWAGRCRNYDMKKGNSIFCPAKDIRKHASQVFGNLRSENFLVGLSRDQFISRLAHYYNLVNKLHPFPEGNGRAQRLFFEYLAAINNCRINWKDALTWETTEVSIQSFAGRLEPTILMFERIVKPL